MTKFFNSAKRHIENEKKQHAKYGHSQTPDAIRARERRDAERKRRYYSLLSPAQELSAVNKLAESLAAKMTPIEDEEMLKKMHEPDEVDKLVQSLHIKYLNKHEEEDEV